MIFEQNMKEEGKMHPTNIRQNRRTAKSTFFYKERKFILFFNAFMIFSFQALRKHRMLTRLFLFFYHNVDIATQ